MLLELLDQENEGTVTLSNVETAHLKTQQHIPEEFNLQQHHYENLKSQKCTFGFLSKPLFLVCIGWRRTVQSCLV
jgi:hypothetical protein